MDGGDAFKNLQFKIPAYFKYFFSAGVEGGRITTGPFYGYFYSSIYLFIHKKIFGGGYRRTGNDGSTIGVMLFLAYGIILIKQKSLALKVAAGFAMTASLLLIFNGITFRVNMLEQFMHGERYGLRFGVVQMARRTYGTGGSTGYWRRENFLYGVNAVAVYLWKNYHKSIEQL